MHLGHHRPQRPFPEHFVGVDQRHRNNRNLRLQCALEAARLEFSYCIMILVITALWKYDKPTSILCVFRQLLYNRDRLTDIVLDQPFSMNQINKLFHQNAMGFRIINHH